MLKRLHYRSESFHAKHSYFRKTRISLVSSCVLLSTLSTLRECLLIAITKSPRTPFLLLATKGRTPPPHSAQYSALALLKSFSRQSQAAPFPPQTRTEDLQDPLQSAGRPGAAGRLLPQPGGLVGGEPAERGAGSLRLPVERLHQSGRAEEAG